MVQTERKITMVTVPSLAFDVFGRQWSILQKFLTKNTNKTIDVLIKMFGRTKVKVFWPLQTTASLCPDGSQAMFWIWPPTLKKMMTSCTKNQLKTIVLTIVYECFYVTRLPSLPRTSVSVTSATSTARLDAVIAEVAPCQPCCKLTL